MTSKPIPKMFLLILGIIVILLGFGVIGCGVAMIIESKDEMKRPTENVATPK